MMVAVITDNHNSYYELNVKLFCHPFYWPAHLISNGFLNFSFNCIFSMSLLKTPVELGLFINFLSKDITSVRLKVIFNIQSLKL